MELEKVIENRNNEIDRILNDKDNIKKVDNKWIEQEAAFHLKSELNKYDGLFDASDIKTKDGGISYDGIVEVMKDGSSKAKDLLGRIDVQVKGTLVDKIPNGNSKFRIEIKHLENYAKNILGVLLFVVYIEKGTKTKKIFYRNLLPIDLKKIFYKINENDDKDKKISIDIYPIDSNKKMALKKVCANFLKAQSKQVNKRIMVLEPDIKIKEILVQDMRDNKGEYLKDKAYLYVKIHEDEGFIPAILGSGGKMSTVEKVNNPIILNGTKYYDKYKVVTSEEERYIVIDETITIKKGTIHFTLEGNIEKKIKDMRFAVEFLKTYGINAKEDIEKLQVSIEVLEKFNGLLQKLGIHIKDRLPALTDEDYKNISYFFRIMENEKNMVKIFSEPTVFPIKLCGKEIILIANIDNENKNQLVVWNYFDNKLEGKIVLGYKGQYYKVTPYIWLKDKKIEKILNYDKNIVENSIKDCMINDIIADNLNQLLLSYILAYDKTKDENYYEVAMMIANKLVEFNTENHVYMINKLQLCKRKRELTKQEINILQEYKNKKDINNIEAFCIAKILGNKADIEYYYNEKLNDEEKAEINKYPIINL